MTVAPGDVAGEGGLEEAPGRWVLPVSGGVVTQVVIDYAFGLTIERRRDHTSVHVRISGQLDYGTIDHIVTVDPEVTATLGPLLTLHSAAVAEGYALKDGHLVLCFGDGRSIRVAPHDHYEAWQVTGRLPPVERKFELIAVPGGGLAPF